jgi:hypothetical protein
MNLLQLRRAVRSRMGVPTSDQMFTDDVIDDHINLANGSVSSEHNWPWDEASTAVAIVDGVVTMPADWRTTQSLFFITGGAATELNNVSSSDALRVVGAGSSPSMWTETGDVIHVRPITAGTLDGALLVYYRDATPLVDDTDTPRMPSQYNGSIIAKAAELLSLREDNRGAAELHATEYSQWLGRMRRSLRRSTSPITPRVREGSWI